MHSRKPGRYKQGQNTNITVHAKQQRLAARAAWSMIQEVQTETSPGKCHVPRLGH